MAPRSLSAQSCREAFQLTKVPSSLEGTMLLCPGGRNAALSLGCPAQGGASRAIRNTNTQLFMILMDSMLWQKGSSEEREYAQNKEMWSGNNYKISV